MKKLMTVSLFVFLFTTSFAFATEGSKRTCYKHSNYDFEIELTLSAGKLQTVAFSNSDWSTTGPELTATILYSSELLSVYSVDQGKILLEVETQILKGQQGFMRSGTEIYDCL